MVAVAAVATAVLAVLAVAAAVLVRRAVRCQAVLVRRGKVPAAVATLLPATLVVVVVAVLEQLAPMPHL